MFDAAKEKRRVIATGLIAYNARHEPIRVELRGELRLLRRESELPSISELLGSDPELTGALSTEDFVRSLRE